MYSQWEALLCEIQVKGIFFVLRIFSDSLHDNELFSLDVVIDFYKGHPLVSILNGLFLFVLKDDSTICEGEEKQIIFLYYYHCINCLAL